MVPSAVKPPGRHTRPNTGAAKHAGLVGFGYDMGALAEASDGSSSSVQHSMEVTDAAAEEIERRWAEPLRRHKLWRADVRQGRRALRAYTGIMGRLLADVKARAAAGQLLDSSVAGHLLRLRAPGSNGPLPDDLLLPEVAVGACCFFFGTLCLIRALRRGMHRIYCVKLKSSWWGAQVFFFAGISDIPPVPPELITVRMAHAVHCVY